MNEEKRKATEKFHDKPTPKRVYGARIGGRK